MRLRTWVRGKHSSGMVLKLDTFLKVQGSMELDVGYNSALNNRIYWSDSPGEGLQLTCEKRVGFGNQDKHMQSSMSQYNGKYFARYPLNEEA